MTNKEQLAATTSTVEFESDGYDCDDDEGGVNANDCNNEDDDGDDGDYDDDEIVEAKYEKYRDDQMNTGVIAALLGGFALTNSWEMDVSSSNEEGLIDLTAYCLAILSVHACTCSALTSAFLYRSLTQQSTPRKAVGWMQRHCVLASLPWYKFMGGTLCYLVSVMLVAWSTLETRTGARAITLFAGICGCGIVLYTFYVIYTDIDPGSNPDSKTAASIRTTKRTRMPLKRIPNSTKKNMKKKHAAGAPTSMTICIS